MSTFEQESKSPYYSIRVRVGTVVSPKAWIGYLDRSIEITYGNQDTKTIKNPKDVAETLEERSLMDDLETKWVGLNEWAKQHDLKFVDQVSKDDKGDPYEKSDISRIELENKELKIENQHLSEGLEQEWVI